MTWPCSECLAGVDDEAVVTEVSAGSAAEAAGVSGCTATPSRQQRRQMDMLSHALMHLVKTLAVSISSGSSRGGCVVHHTCMSAVCANAVFLVFLLLIVVAQCCVGDVVRATSAMTMQMVYPTMNIMFGGERRQQQQQSSTGCGGSSKKSAVWSQGHLPACLGELLLCELGPSATSRRD